MKKTKKAVIFAPFWRQSGHVGNYRVDRFVRWLAAAGFHVVLIRAGSVSGQSTESWGLELTVRDPLGLYRDAAADGAPVKTRRPSRLRRPLAYWLFNPDPGILWARAAAKNSTVLKHAHGASFVLSSSPPESAHIGAAKLARSIKTRLIIDMRDGWLDEPLKPLLRDSRLQRWREGSLENTILQQADKILVTSPVWKSLLADRLPFTQEKTVVLTNGYPPDGLFHPEPTRERPANAPLRLIHAGRFTGSRLSQRASYLLEPLLMGLGNTQTQGVVMLLGRLEAADLEEITQWQPRFKAMGWSIELKDAVPRNEMMAILAQSDGLILLSTSKASIPSKLFEYLPIGKPIFAVAPQSSAVWGIGESLVQFFLTDYEQPNANTAALFISACETNEHGYEVPEQFHEKILSRIFIREVSIA